ncbi:MAG: hypothetical protein A4E58_02023 [Syntrophorhabdus sp. PtaB.Bin006]|nr:MAG: hypothetical protein A4E58_02023 [Syntrophorhabdus sp. PtaB.Bin006]
MKPMEHCYACLRGLADKAVTLSKGDDAVLSHSYSVIDDLWDDSRTPPEIANKLLGDIKGATGTYDPYVSIKDKEVEMARRAVTELGDAFPDTLEGLLMFSALGNSMDFFIDSGYDTTGFEFAAEVDTINTEIHSKGKDVLMFADNVGELLFDVGLIKYLEAQGKFVSYAVKEHPVQNDLSVPDVERFRFREVFPNIISTGSGEVGIRRELMRGRIKDMWEGDAIVIAKGMANYETISEYGDERTVIHIMKVKCPTVARAVGYSVGQYIAIIGGEKDGGKKRLL